MKLKAYYPLPLTDFAVELLTAARAVLNEGATVENLKSLDRAVQAFEERMPVLPDGNILMMRVFTEDES